MSRTSRPVALSRRGMVASPHYLASLAALRTLQDGGNAVDAAISANATLSVVYPHMTGIGGDAFWLIYDAARRGLHGLNGSGRAGARVTPERMREELRRRGSNCGAMPSRGPLSAATVPGAVDSWTAAHARFGRLPLADLLAPAIEYARDGYPVSAGLASVARESADILNRFPDSTEMFLPGGAPPRHGDIQRHEKLAQTLEAIAEKGRDGFYSGPIASSLVAALSEAGGLLTVEDLEGHTSDWTEPVSTTYRGFTCYQHPPNSQGLIHLLTLNILENFDLSSMEEDSAAHVHLVTEATKFAYADRARYLTDPEFADIPVDTLLSEDYARKLSALIDPEHIGQPARKGPESAGDTTCTVVVDSAGNAVSVIQSVCHAFGSGFVAGDTGVLLHNRASTFSLETDHVNRLEPGKRTFHTLMPGMLFRNGFPFLVYGTMGGEGQPQTNTALVTRIVDFGWDVQAAIERPRILYGSFWGNQADELSLEGRYPAATFAGLRERGHSIQVLSDWENAMGHAQAISIDPHSGVLSGGADPRGDGIAVGW